MGPTAQQTGHISKWLFAVIVQSQNPQKFNYLCLIRAHNTVGMDWIEFRITNNTI